MIVRPEEPEDHAQIAVLVERAFDSTVEARLVEALRASPGYVPELALVADDGEVVGHVMFTVAHLEDGPEYLLLAPLAVRPDRQRSGVGTALVEEGLRRARGREQTLLVVEGDPRYYSRFGFVRAAELGLERPSEQTPEWAFQAMALRAGGQPRGRVVYPPPFEGL